MSDGVDLELHPLLEWDAVLDDSSYYELLGVLEIADDEAIKQGFRDFALNFHPDVHHGAEPELYAIASRIFERGAEAYRVLGNPQLRAAYDRALERGVVRLDRRAIEKPETLPLGAKSLRDLCRTPAAQLEADKAQAALDAGKLREAHRHLQFAIATEGPDVDAELVERLDAIDLVMFASGD